MVTTSKSKNSRSRINKPRELQPYELRNAAAEAGDPIALFAAIAGSPAAEMDTAKEFARLQRLVAKACQTDAAGFASAVLDQGLGMIGYLALRLHVYVEFQVQKIDRAYLYKAGSRLPPEISEKVLPQLMQMHKHLADIGLIKATIDRQQQLAAAKRIEIEQRTQEQSAPSKRLTSTSRSQRPAKGQSSKCTAGRKPARSLVTADTNQSQPAGQLNDRSYSHFADRLSTLNTPAIY